MITKRLVLLLVLLAMAPAAQAARIDIVAVVNDDVITSNDVEERRALIMMTHGIPPTEENMRKLDRTVIAALIDETLQLQEAKRLSINISKDELETATATLEQKRTQAPGTVKAMLEEQGLTRTFDRQLKAQLAWNKVVQRKLRRSVTISTDEVARAQAAEAAAPGVEEVRIGAISVLLTTPEEEEANAKLAAELGQRLAEGQDLGMIAGEYASKPNVRISPPVWVTEEGLQPAMGQAIRTMKDGEVTPPLKSMNTFQVVKLYERRTTKPLPENTEVVIKDIAFAMPAEQNEKAMLALRETVTQARANPGSCMDTQIGVADTAVEVRYVRTTYGAMPPQTRSIIAHMGVGEVSEPLAMPEAVRLMLLCERIEPATGSLPNAEKVRQDLFAEKIELESQKHLRNLKRDAFIDVKTIGEPSE